MLNLYDGREQTKAKHFILKRYLQELAFKVLTFSDLTYVDGFSGPWQERDEGFADTSFKIAINTLKDAQKIVLNNTKALRRIRCFFSESDPQAYERLRPVVEAFHDPANHFEVQTYGGRFEDAVPDIQQFIAKSIPLVFIDPTGWTGYPLEKIKPIFSRPRCEVLVNFMYDYINRFVSSDDAEIVSSFDAILGGPGWRNRLDPALPRGPAVERLFRTTLRDTCGFEFVVSTKIDKSTSDRPHFFIAYGTKKPEGLKAFRDVEYQALREHRVARASAKERRKETRTGQSNLFQGLDQQVEEASLDEIIDEQIVLAKARLLEILKSGPLSFEQALPRLLQPFMIRETNLKDICVALAKDGLIENTWGRPPRKPSKEDLVILTTDPLSIKR